MSQSSDSQGTTSLDQFDGIDGLIDYSGYENITFPSPAISSSNPQYSRQPSNPPASSSSQSQRPLPGPSHDYDLYRQTTGIPPGAIANTMAINSLNMHINPYASYTDPFLTGLGLEDDLDFGTAPNQKAFNPSDIDMDYNSPKTEPTLFFGEQQSSSGYIDPSAIGGSTASLPVTPVVPTSSSNVGRLYPGMHQQQAAVAKAQAKQKQQQQLIQQQQRQSMSGPSRRPSHQPSVSPHNPNDPMVAEKISQLLSSMRHGSINTDADGESHSDNGNGMGDYHSQKNRKEMDPDELLLASEEGKKLTSQQRRQLRNKVSARAFRSRRKEYIGQLEGELATKANEMDEVKAQNRALQEENRRLTDLTRMLLSSSAFSGFVGELTTNPAAAQVAQAPLRPQQQPSSQSEQPRHVRKDVNPYGQQPMQHQHIGLTMIPEHSMDFSMIDLNAGG